MALSDVTLSNLTHTEDSLRYVHIGSCSKQLQEYRRNYETPLVSWMVPLYLASPLLCELAMLLNVSAS